MQELVDGLSAHEAWAGAAQDLVRGPDQLIGQGSGKEWQALIRWACLPAGVQHVAFATWRFPIEKVFFLLRMLWPQNSLKGGNAITKVLMALLLRKANTLSAQFPTLPVYSYSSFIFASSWKERDTSPQLKAPFDLLFSVWAKVQGNLHQLDIHLAPLRASSLLACPSCLSRRLQIHNRVLGHSK